MPGLPRSGQSGSPTPSLPGPVDGDGGASPTGGALSGVESLDGIIGADASGFVSTGAGSAEPPSSPPAAPPSSSAVSSSDVVSMVLDDCAVTSGSFELAANASTH